MRRHLSVVCLAVAAAALAAPAVAESHPPSYPATPDGLRITSFHVTGASVNVANGESWLFGTYSCNRPKWPGFGVVWLGSDEGFDVLQRAPHHTVLDVNSDLVLPCKVDVQRWSTWLGASGLRPGRATFFTDSLAAVDRSGFSKLITVTTPIVVSPWH